MATWNEFSTEAPELAVAIRRRFEATKHHVLATVRADGSPRVSGTEVEFAGAHLELGSMAGARKARDLQRDARFALHANPGDGSMADGDAKLAGRAVEDTDSATLRQQQAEQPGSHRFRLDLDEAVLTAIHPDGNRLLIQMWRPGRGVTSFERA